MPASSQPTELKSWEEIEQLPTKEQRAYLQQALQNREPIKKFSDIKLGDHLVRKGSFCGKAYEHHFLVVGLESDDRVTIIHYHGTASRFWTVLKTDSFRSGASLGEVACVQEVTLPHEDFIENESELQKKGEEVERVVWPDELRRYPVEEVIKRARERTKETFYDLVKNNCESFIMWSICGINFSLQSATTSVTIQTELIKAISMSLCHVGKSLPKITVEFVELLVKHFVFGAAIETCGTEALSVFGCSFGLPLALAVDVACLAWSISDAKKKWDEGVLIKTRQEFIKEVVHLVILHVVRFGAFVAGCIIGQMVIPVPVFGGIVGILGGSLFGHWLGKGASYLFSESIASAVEALLQVLPKLLSHLIAGISGRDCSLSLLPISSSPQLSLPL